MLCFLFQVLRKNLISGKRGEESKNQLKDHGKSAAKRGTHRVVQTGMSVSPTAVEQAVMQEA